MKKLLFLSAFALCATFATLESCKKNNEIQTDSIQQNESDYTEDIEEIEAEVIADEKDDNDDYQADARFTMESCVSDNIVGNIEQYSQHECNNLFRYPNYNVVMDRYAGQLGRSKLFKFKITRPDTLLDSITVNKPQFIYIEKINGRYINKVDSVTYSFQPRQVGNEDTMKAFSATFSAFRPNPNGTITTIKKTIKVICRNEYNQTFGTWGWGLSYIKKFELQMNCTQCQDFPITRTYIPQKGDLISMGKYAVGNSGTVNYKNGYITTTPTVIPATTTKPKRYRFRLSEWDNRSCRSTRTNKYLTVAEGDSTGYVSIDTSYRFKARYDR